MASAIQSSHQINQQLHVHLTTTSRQTLLDAIHNRALHTMHTKTSTSTSTAHTSQTEERTHLDSNDTAAAHNGNDTAPVLALERHKTVGWNRVVSGHVMILLRANLVHIPVVTKHTVQRIQTDLKTLRQQRAGARSTIWVPCDQEQENEDNLRSLPGTHSFTRIRTKKQLRYTVVRLVARVPNSNKVAHDRCKHSQH